jgi:hypothetical protein
MMIEARLAPLSPGDSLPNVSVFDGMGQAHSLIDLIHQERANVVIVLSAKCSSCLGELESWKKITLSDPQVRPLIVVYSASHEYLTFVNEYIAPPYGVYRVRQAQLESLGALRTPLAYLVDSGAVAETALGPEQCARLRTELEAANVS